MKAFLLLVSVLSVFLGLRYVSNRLAQHLPPLPGVTKRINTQVHRINQS